MKTTRDYTYSWMIHNLPPEEITLANYIAINWCHEKTHKDLAGEELACLPKGVVPGASQQSNSMKATRITWETAVRIVIRIGRKKIIDMFLPRGSSASWVEQDKVKK